MQENGTVPFEPMYDDAYQPWFTQLFAFYLLIVFVLLAVQISRLLWSQLKLRKLDKLQMLEDPRYSALLTSGYARIVRLKELVSLTFLLGLLDLSWSIADIFIQLRTERSHSWSYVLSRVGDAFTPFCLALIACIVLFATAMTFRFLLDRRMMASSMKKAE